ncbi:MAG: hypothetical protein AB7G75_27215 [Candidatus Binatia bacterium]
MRRYFFRRTSWVTGIFFLALGSVAFPLRADCATEDLDSNRPEAWALNYFSSVSLLAGLGTPYSREPGSCEVGFEMQWLPKLSKSKRRVGFNGLKEEDLNKAPIFARPRLTIGLPWRTALTLAYLPPIRLFGVKPHLFAFALERPLYEQRPWTLGVRLYGQVGQIEGAFTCSRDVAKFPPGSPNNPFGCNKKSADTVTQQYGGVELSGSYRIESVRGLTPYIAVAGNFLDNKFQVKARTFGVRDRNRRVAQTWTFSATAGAIYPLTDRLHLNLSLFYTPLSIKRPPSTDGENDALFNVRAGISYRWG